MKILCISDQFEGVSHSAIEGIFAQHIQSYCESDIVYFSKIKREPERHGYKIILPYSTKHRGFLRALSVVASVDSYDLIIVRNFYSIASQLLVHKQRKFKLAFWETFPHELRRVIEDPRSLRKRLGFWLKNTKNIKILNQCDLFLPVTHAYAPEYYPTLKVPVYILPMGINEAELESKELKARAYSGVPLKFVYSGTIDQPREVFEIAKAFSKSVGDFQVDFFTQSQNKFVAQIESLQDPRIRVIKGMSRKELLNLLQDYHIGLGLIPPSKLYIASLPTKTIEYAALGVIPLINFLPEYQRMFDRESAFFCDFEEESIKQAIHSILQKKPEELCAMSQCVRQKASQKTYTQIAKNFCEFLRDFL